MNKKDWTDALREKDLFEGEAPSPASWEVVGRRVRRAAALRRGGLTAVALLPVVALLLWAPWHRPAGPAAPADKLVAQQQPAAPAQPAAPVAVVPAPPAERPAPVPARVKPAPAAPAPAESVPAAPEVPAVPESPESPVPAGPGAVPEEAPEAAPGTAVPDPGASEPLIAMAPETPSDPFAFDEPETRRHRPRLSVGVRAGSGTARRSGEVRMHEYPTLLAANYLNSYDPSWVDNYLKSNGIYHDGLQNGLNGQNNYWGSLPDARAYYADTPVSRYQHDLPLTLGLSVRLSLTPRIGLESGLDYTYLRSVEEVDGARLEQRLHFVGIPLRADARIWSRGGFDFYAGLGVEVEKCVSATLGLIPCSEPALQWSAGAFAGFQYRLGPQVRLYFQPELSYYFTRTELVTIRTEHPLSVALQAGLRFEL